MTHERLGDRILSSDSLLVLPFELAVVGYWIIQGTIRSVFNPEQPADCAQAGQKREVKLSPYDYKNPDGALYKQL